LTVLSEQTDFVPLTEVTRGGHVESVHFGSVAVVDTDGRLCFSAGAADRTIFTRSACKPFQAMPFAFRGGPARFELTPAEVAVTCASHSGEPMHLEAVRSILDKIDMPEDALLCGSHVPYSYRQKGLEGMSGKDFSPLYNNCSGKHAGMLGLCKMLGVATEDYLDANHPVQQEILTSVSYFTGVSPHDMDTGIDGCSAPNYAVPLKNMAWAFAKLATAKDCAQYGSAPAVLFDAMTRHPQMISGEGRGDLTLMTAGQGDWVTKVGGESVQGIGIRSKGLGIAVKIADGNTRAITPVVIEVLRQLGLVTDARETLLKEAARPVLKNHRNIETGEIRPVFQLHKVEST
jgi:L-asparaginase II